MPFDHNITQYDKPFQATRLGNFEIPKQKVKKKKRPVEGITRYIANDEGKLLDKKFEHPKGPRTDFVPTWHMPLKIPGPHALNATARKKSMAKKLESDKNEFEKKMKEKSAKRMEPNKVEHKMNQQVECERPVKNMGQTETMLEPCCNVPQNEPVNMQVNKCDELCQKKNLIDECNEIRRKEAEEREVAKEDKCNTQEMYDNCQQIKDLKNQLEKVENCQENRRFESCVQNCVHANKKMTCAEQKKMKCEKKLKKWECDFDKKVEESCCEKNSYLDKCPCSPVRNNY